MGSLAAGSAAAMGTGAFTTEASRAMSIDVVGSESAYLGVDPETGSEYVEESSPMSINLAGNSDYGGSGLFEESDTAIAPAFELQNQSDETLYVEVENPLANNDISTPSLEGPAGVDVQFLTVPSLPLRDYNGKGGLALIGRDSKVEGSGNGLGGGFDDPGSNEYWFHQGPNDTPSNAPNRTALTQSSDKSAAGALEIAPGQSFPVVFRVVVNDVAENTEANEPRDIDANFTIEAFDTTSKLTYDTVNDIWPSDSPS